MGVFDAVRDVISTAALQTLSKAEDQPPKKGGPSSSGREAQDSGSELQIGEAAGPPQSILWDPFAIIDALGYKEKPSPITYATLAAMPRRMPILSAIIKCRADQVSNFSEPQEDKFSTGFRIALRDRKKSPTKASEKKSLALQQWVTTTGKTTDPTTRDSFDAFLRKYVWDALRYDQPAFEVIPDRSGRPHSFVAVDGATIRVADTTKLFHTGLPTETRYVQILDNMVVAEYTSQELCFGIRNPTTDLINQGYGTSELEMLISTVTSLLWAWDYNQRFFSQGTSTKGIINFKGTVPEKQLRAFRRHWYSMVAGVENAFKTPITSAEDLQYINLQQSNSDMEFSAWFDFLIKVACAAYGMDPMEINFRYGDSGGGSTMFADSQKAKLTESKDKGLKPLLRNIQGNINRYLIQPLDEDFEFQFVGLEAQTPVELADLNTKLLSSYKMVDEVRAEEDLPPLPDGLGQVILNAVWLQNKTAGAQGGPGDMGAEGEEVAPDPFGSELDALQADADAEIAVAGEEDPGEPVKPAKPGAPAKPDGVDKSQRAAWDNLRKAGTPVVIEVEL